ncbi:uncharacterized protein [Haliotis cracherodii]|uniref:uncharacterized protein n=1 Tax=Haliotis cracherodii TaxID=6455 RepID=UPI0039ECFCF2
MWKVVLYAVVMLSATSYAQTMPPSQCDVAAINSCTTSLADSIRGGTESTDSTCRAADMFVMCLNKLTSCMDDPAFTQARQWMDSLQLKDSCPHLGHYPHASAGGIPAFTAVLLLIPLLTLWIFT